MPKQSTDQERAASVLAFYGLDGSGNPAITPPGYLPSRQRKGASPAELEIRKRLYYLACGDASAKQLEAATLEKAQLPLIPLGNGKWKIDKAAARKEEDIIAENKDLQLAANVREFYGIDGQSTAIVSPGLVPNQTSSTSLSHFETYMRKHLYDLSVGRVSAGRWEAEALQQAEIPLLQREDGKWIINIEEALTEKEAKEVIADQENAAKVRAFYGIDGTTEAIGEWGVLPSEWSSPEASSLEKDMLLRLYKLSYGESAAGELEAEALQEAGLPVIKNRKGKFFIDRDALKKASRQMTGASQDAGLSQGMGDMSIAPSPGSSSYPVSMSAWDTSAMQDSAGQTGGFDYPMNPVQTWPHLLIDQGYTQAGSSSQVGPSSYGGPPSHQHAGRPSKRGPK
ncbi:hypothetical protein PV387_42255 [Streptomyces sp. ME02-6987-2C]|nr:MULTISPECIES: hypothetical protein [unclassified Streptomyces]MDX3372504.1 hypothetical protein [Streptomyces sp. ME02-6987-2C]MDX3427273.1 hypothetical protein [Streptomyces sp. ME02-6985-2c]